MLETLPLMELLKEVHRAMEISDQSQQSGVKCTVLEDNYTVFEDNNGCIELGKSPKMRLELSTQALNIIIFEAKCLIEQSR